MNWHQLRQSMQSHHESRGSDSERVQREVQDWQTQARIVASDFLQIGENGFDKQAVHWPKLAILPSPQLRFGTFVAEDVEAGTVLGVYPGTVSFRCPRKESEKDFCIECSPAMATGSHTGSEHQEDVAEHKSTKASKRLQKRYLTAFDIATDQTNPQFVDADLGNGFRSSMWYVNDDPVSANSEFHLRKDVRGFPVVAVVAIRCLKVGEEVLVNYGPQYFQTPRRRGRRAGPRRLFWCRVCNKRSLFRSGKGAASECTFCLSS